ncbi:MAG: pyridoxamine 5'-phosphate oxidase family protein [Dehalococcoidia bacterium]
MATWAAFETAAPDIAAVGRTLLEKHNLAYLATIRRNGAPRLHPVCPFIIEGRLFVCTPPSSPKVKDQLRDGRCVIHMLPGEDDDEFSVRCHASLITDAAFKQRASEHAHYVRVEDCLFEYDIEEAHTAYWVNAGQPGTYAERRKWIAKG